MSWEVRSMKSGTSFFNRSYSLHLLRRFWPLWALWLALLILIGPVLLGSAPPESFTTQAEYVNNLNRTILESGRILAFLSILAGPLVAMAMLSWLYSPRICGMVNSLPMKRETVWFTSVLTGLLPMLAADLLVFLVILAGFGGRAGVETAHVWTWLKLVVLGNTAFYGMACFCGVLTGNVLVLPAVYLVLGCTASVAESTARALLGDLVYGYTYDSLWLHGLSPFLHLTTVLHYVGRLPGTAQTGTVQPGTVFPDYHMEGMGYLAAIAAAGVLLILLALPVLKKRNMESAGEIVAVPVLRPVFRVCMAVGCGLVGAAALCETVLCNLLHGRALAAAVVAALCASAFVGFFAAQMLMKKTLRVFGGGWKQLGVICACLALFALLAEYDVMGYETRLPESAEVASVMLPNSLEVSGPESIAACLEAHRGLIANKDRDEAAGSSRRGWVLQLDYALKNGKHFSRRYRIPINEADESDPTSSAMLWQALSNTPEAILVRAGARNTFTAGTIRYASVSVVHPTGDPMRGWQSEDSVLTPEQAESLYREGILPDAKEGNIARNFVSSGAEQQRELTNVTVQIERETVRRLTPDGMGYYYDSDASLWLSVLESSSHTRRWLEENLGVVPENQYALEQSVPASDSTPKRVYA